MSERTPNHVCKACGKAYYACPDCDRINSWRSMACSPQCYQKYMQMVLEARTPVVVQSSENEHQSYEDEQEKMEDEEDSSLSEIPASSYRWPTSKRKKKST